ncbi:EpsG family protein, partial [Dysgonomonas sp. HGC4]
MIPYIVLFSLICFLAVPFNYKKIKGYDRFFMFISIIILCLFSGLASSRGDYLSYKDIFNAPFDNSAVEKGFQILNYSVSFIGGGYHLLLILVALIAISLKILAFKELTPFLGLATIIYIGGFFPPADMGSIRFGVAMGFFLLSLKHIKKHQIWKFTLIILLGCTFHGSLIISFLLYFIYARNLRVKHY